MTRHNAEYRKMGLTVLTGHEPMLPFRFENPIGLGKCEILPGVAIGAHTYMNSGFIRSYVVIGRYCSIGRNVTIGSGVHDIDALSTNPFFKINSNGPILRLADTEKKIRTLIGHDVWIGDNAYIMSGIRVGDGAIIAAGAIVTKDVEPYSIVTGIPAKFLKWRYDETTRQRLHALQWHEFDAEHLGKLDIGNIQKCLDDMESWPDSYRSKKTPDYTCINKPA